MENRTSYKTYWMIWGVLLVLTLLMIFLETIELSRAVTILLLSAAMMTKATLIAGWFMHLKYETTALILSVGLSILLTAAFMFGLLVPDGVAALQMAQ